MVAWKFTADIHATITFGSENTRNNIVEVLKSGWLS